MARISPQAFLRHVRGAELIRLFDLMPDVSFFIKDRQGRFVALNRRGCDYCGVKAERDAVGKTDRDFFPHQRAQEYARDDDLVMSTGQPIINRVESAPEAEGSPRLVMTSKLPLRDETGQVIGIAGFSRAVKQQQPRGQEHTTGEARFARIIEHMHRHPQDAMPSATLARMAGLSQSQFDRSFRKVFKTSARQYLLRVRVEAVCRRLAETDDTIAALAQEFGFFDHAHLSRCFQQAIGISPSRYRQQQRAPQVRAESSGRQKIPHKHHGSYPSHQSYPHLTAPSSPSP